MLEIKKIYYLEREIMKKAKFAFIVFGVIVAAVSCKTSYDAILDSSDMDLKMRSGIDYYNRGKYRKAANIFESMILLSQGTVQEDSVQYYNAMSNYRSGDYYTAEANFEKFLEVFPRSRFSEESQFLRIKCLYEQTHRWELDQVPTHRAMGLIREFIYDNPQSQYIPICNAMLDEFQERLDRKSYEASKLYYDMEDFKAAQTAFKTALKENSDNRYREQMLYYTALSSFKYADNSIKERQKERFMTYIDDYYNFVGEYPSSPDRKLLDRYFARAQKYVGINVGLDSSQLAAVAELSNIEEKAATGVKGDRRSTKKAIKSAKKAVKDAERENAVAHRLESEKKIYDDQLNKKAKKAEEKAARREATRLYKEAKAKQKAAEKAAKKAMKEKK